MSAIGTLQAVDILKSCGHHGEEQNDGEFESCCVGPFELGGGSSSSQEPTDTGIFIDTILGVVRNGKHGHSPLIQRLGLGKSFELG
ncbi:hypothetical protein GYMLUDRAFT_245138 [Collybiopsis luxurians FD-317 M1]|uniref:Uncharacterized protein n=1 Tax=Collybiopsis luxurians FD-317 M1 TaxID=944289 RepID=A0A0D0CUG1_9AGAR|nr:hypothetical protein GYMLUDRAFT_245138 [Collybiopsis luxurians FD-317 M1]